MKIHCLLHVDFETPGYIEEWAEWNNFELAYTRLYENGKLPSVSEFDMLVVMGGPMGVYDSDKYKWLKDEMSLIKLAIAKDKYVLGICLGAQLIAASMGAKVYPSGLQEIGWYTIKLSELGAKIWGNFDPDNRWVVLHWHGDTFDLPDGAQLLASSEATNNQAFKIGKKVLGFQFHMEATPLTIEGMTYAMADELEKLAGEKWVMTASEIKLATQYLHDNNAILEAILDRFVGNE